MKIFATLLLMILTLLAESSELYKTCAGCHGENGEKQALGQSKIITSQESNLTIKQLTAYKNGELNQYGFGSIMQVQLTSLNDDDIKELAAYIEAME
ncbi:MAG TPA: c-type cytochrome [Campylobacterales bacterium]|nr:c-type cytochrome [Campylobacterales bacterium]HHS93226.1 c-type cytochrome [Campylobacterales bacterium]